MKNNTRKILIAFLLVFAMMIGVTTVFAGAATTSGESVTIYFQNNWLWSEVSCHYWGSALGDTTWPGIAMEVVDNDGTYDIYAVSIPSDVTGIVINGKKDDGSGQLDQTPDITSGIVNGAGWCMAWDNGNIAQPYDYTGSGGVVTPPTPPAPPVSDFSSYTVAGTSSLCGTEWDTTNTANDLVAGADGIYSITFKSVPAGTHKFKVVADYTWDNAWPASDYSFTLSESCDVTIKFNPETKKVEVIADKLDTPVAPPEGEYYSYTVAGVLGLCGVEWAVDYATNDMTFNPATGLYEKTFTGIQPGSYECKVAANHSWDISWGTEGNGEFGNFVVTVEEESNVTITFDPTTYTIAYVLSESTGPSTDVPPAPSVDFENCGKIVVYLGNSANWVNPTVHAWVEGTTDVPYTTWPGLPMEWDSEKLLYYIELPAICDSVVFSDSGTPQSADLVIPEPNAIFDNVTNQWSSLKDYEPPIPPSDSEVDVTVYVKDTAHWGGVYIYYWNMNGEEAFAFPGIEMDLGDDGYYYATIPAGYCGVVFSNGGDWVDGSLLQTEDLKIPADNKVYLDNDDGVWYAKGGATTPDVDTPDVDTPDLPGDDAPVKEMTFLQKIAKALLLFLRSIEDFFKNLFPAAKQ